MKRAPVYVCAAAVLFIIAYLASPVLGYYRIQEAARSGNQDALEATVDFPAVRESLKAQLSAGLAAKAQSDPKLKSNPFARFGMMLAGALVGKVVDTYLTPEAIGQMVSQAKAPGLEAQSPVDGIANPKLEKHYAYISLDRFRVTAVDPSHPDRPFSFVMERRWLFDWKLIRIELPAALFR
jgi:hypothetical protein